MVAIRTIRCSAKDKVQPDNNAESNSNVAVSLIAPLLERHPDVQTR